MTTTNQEDIVSDETAQADPFAGGADPFDPAATNEPTAVAPEEAPADEPQAADIPIVDKEGEPVEAAATAEPDAPVEAPEPQPAEDGDGEPPEEPPAAPAEAPEPPEAAEEPQEAADEPQDAPEAPEPTGAPVDAPAVNAELADRPDNDGDGEPDAPTAPASNGDGEAPAAEAADPGGKSPLRHYALLYQTGENVWTEYDLSTLSEDMKQHAETKDGKRWLRARNADHARRIAWIIFGRPENGVTVNPVAKSSWNPKRLAPAPPEPTRERLVIS